MASSRGRDREGRRGVELERHSERRLNASRVGALWIALRRIAYARAVNRPQDAARCGERDVVHACDVLVIQYVEAFNQHSGLEGVRKCEITRDARIPCVQRTGPQTSHTVEWDACPAAA